MAALWGVFLEVFQVGLFWLTQFYGGHLASAIVTFSLLARIALLPLTVSLAGRARRFALEGAGDHIGIESLASGQRPGQPLRVRRIGPAATPTSRLVLSASSRLP